MTGGVFDLLSVDFLSYIFWVSEDDVVSIYEAVQWGCFSIFEDFFCLFFGGFCRIIVGILDIAFLICFNKYSIVTFWASFLTI